MSDQNISGEDWPNPFFEPPPSERAYAGIAGIWWPMQTLPDKVAPVEPSATEPDYLSAVRDIARGA